MEGWIDIAEFALKYGVSASTLRRRIRSDSIHFKMHRGKYLLEDSAEALKSAPLFSRRTTTAIAGQAPNQSVRSGSSVNNGFAGSLPDPVRDFMGSEQVLPVHMRDEFDKLQGENKRLKAQIAELETLVKVLESELGGSSH